MAASGRLTEFAGARAIEADREMRRLGLPRAAERKLAALARDTTAVTLLRAYADGVNAWIDAVGPADLPVEFKLLGTRPERWDALATLHVLGRMGWTLAQTAPDEERLEAAARVGDAAAASLFPEHSAVVEPIQPNGQAAPRFDAAPLAPPGAPDSAAARLVSLVRAALPGRADARAALAQAEGEHWRASNNWAVAPRRTRAGHALLAGDPHLELSLPSIWYEAHLVVPGQLDVYGVTIPGLPGIAIGFNRDVAWTVTNTGADVMDFYAETVDDAERPSRYRVDGRWRPLEARVETYRAPDGEIVAADTVRYTHRGPMRRHGTGARRAG
jgi:penicillin amidase